MADENPQVGRREFLTGVGVAGAAAATALAPVAPAPAQVIQAAAPAPAAKLPDGYLFLHPQEAQFVEAVVDHMVPKDELTPSGTDMGIATFIDRALAVNPNLAWAWQNSAWVKAFLGEPENRSGA